MNWNEIALELNNVLKNGTRVAKQCRERYNNKLNPDLKKSPWTIEEDINLINFHNQFGNSWIKIANLVPGKSLYNIIIIIIIITIIVTVIIY
jgi:hypothetical protein